MTDHRPPACRCCGSTATTLIGRGARGRRFAGMLLDPALDGGWLYRCAKCDLLMRHPMLSDAEYVALYARAAGDFWSRSALRPEQQRLRDHVQRVLPAGGRVLDVGCSSGELLHSLGSSFKTFGIEPSQEAARHARDVGVDVIGPTIEALAETTHRFDLITAIDVIEHLADPLQFLHGLGRHLAPGGRIVVSTGNSRASVWRWVGPGYYYAWFFEHVSFISDRWCAFVAGQDFEVEIIERLFSHRSAEGDGVASRLRRYLTFAAKLVPAWVERVVATRLPTTSRRLGLRLIVGEPGLFDDHIMVSFTPRASAPGG